MARYDLVVIGGGAAGLVSAMGAAGLGARTALVEERLLGGDCLNFGCVPSKTLLAAAARGENLAQARHRIEQARLKLAPADSARRLAEAGVHVFFGRASFADRRSIEVSGQRLRFRRAVIATGTSPALPDIPGLAETEPLNNETVFDLEHLPQSLAVLGGGPVGCELAQAFARMGSRVTLLEAATGLLPREDEDAAALVAKALTRDGVDCRTASTLVAVTNGSGLHRLELASGQAVEVDRILVATGRAVGLEKLGLERAGVAWGRSGVVVNDRMATTNARVFACGDVSSTPYRLTQAADAEARLVLRNALFRGRARTGRLVMPWCTYTSPELAHVGISSDEARSMAAVETITIRADQVDRFVVENDSEGFLRVHVKGPRGKILGATIVGTQAGELIATISLAMKAGLGLATLAETVLPYPTRAEIIVRAAAAWRRSKLTPMAARILRALIRLPG